MLTDIRALADQFLIAFPNINFDLTRCSSLCECLVTNGAKDGILWQLRLVSRFKGPFFTP